MPPGTKRTLMIASITLSLMLSIAGCVKQGNTTSNETTSAEPDTWTETVLKADLIVLGTITDLKYQVVTTYHGDNLTERFPSTDNLTVVRRYAYTIFTLTVERVIKGDPNTREVFIKKPGGPLGNNIYQAPSPGSSGVSLSDRVLLTLKQNEDGTYYDFYVPAKGEPIYIEGKGGVLWLEGNSTINLNEVTGRILQIMIKNNIPVAIPSE